MKTLLVVAMLALSLGAQPAPPSIQSGDFLLTYDDRGLTGIANPRDPFEAQVLAPGGRLGTVPEVPGRRG